MDDRGREEVRRRVAEALGGGREPRCLQWTVRVPGGASWTMRYATEATMVAGKDGVERPRFWAALYKLRGIFIGAKRVAAHADAVPKKYAKDPRLCERWEKVREVAFARRWKAKDRAWRWVCEKKGRTFRSLHKPPKRSKAAQARAARNLGRKP